MESGSLLCIAQKEVMTMENDILLKILGKFDKMDERFDKLDEQLGEVNQQLGRVEGRLSQVERRLDRVETRLGHVEDKLDATFDQAARLTEGQTETRIRLEKLESVKIG
jgi:septation ring formation regulator EzrA